MNFPLRIPIEVALLAALSLTLPFAATGCATESKAAGTSTTRDEADHGAAKAPLSTKFVKVRSRKAPREVVVTGSLAGDESSEVATQAAGVVTAVLVDLGTRVKKGDVLVTLDRRDAELRLAQAQASLQQAIAKLGMKASEKFDAAATPDVRAAKEALDFAQLDADRNKSLLDTGAITKAQYDPIRSRLESAKAQYDSAMAGASTGWAGVATAQTAVSLAAKQLADTSIRAPFDGSVAEKRITDGEYANVGKIVCVVVQDDPLRLKIDLPETDLAAVALGQKV
ncbi:MAG: efflux RND transporter periplasmic adaptor subunit, partial [Polyangiales bacterium]